MFAIGDALREARVRKGLTLKDVEDGTKIRSKYIQALEEDDFEVIPGPTFVKGFLRTYGGFLGLDTDLLVDEYRSRYEPEHELRSLPVRSRQRSVQRLPERRQPNFLVVGIVALLVVLLLAWVGWGDPGDEPAPMQPNVSDATVTVPTTIETAGEVPSELAPTTTVRTTTTNLIDLVELTLTASEGRCWLEVRQGSAAGEVLYQGTLEKGEKVSKTAMTALWIEVGNPAALTASLNGQKVTIPDQPGRFLATPAGVERID